MKGTYRIAGMIFGSFIGLLAFAVVSKPDPPWYAINLIAIPFGGVGLILGAIADYARAIMDELNKSRKTEVKP